MVNHRRGKSVMINQRIGTQGTPLMFIQPQNMAQNMVLTYLQLDPEDLPLSHQDFFGFVSGSWRLPWCFTEVWMPTLGFTPFHSMGTGSRNGRGIFHGYILILVPQRSPKSYHRWEMNGNRWNRMSFFYCCSIGSAIAVRNETLKTPWMAQIRWKPVVDSKKNLPGHIPIFCG